MVKKLLTKRRLRKAEQGYEAFPAVVVADKTDKQGKRLGALAIGLLVLFFVISSYIQSAKNGKALSEADTDRRALIKSTERLSRTLDQQTQLIKDLQAALKKQNTILIRAGLQPVAIPGLTPLPPQPSKTRAPSNQPTSRPRPRPTNNPSPRPTATPKPGPVPTLTPLPPLPTIPVPSTSPSSANPINNVLCQLTDTCSK